MKEWIQGINILIRRDTFFFFFLLGLYIMDIGLQQNSYNTK